MAISKAQQRATAKYVNKVYDRIEAKVPKGQKEVIQAHAESTDGTLNKFLNRAITETMERDGHKGPSEPSQAPDSILTPATLETAQKAAEFTGETVPAFLERAAEVQAERDQRSHGMADKIAGVKHSKERG